MHLCDKFKERKENKNRTGMCKSLYSKNNKIWSKEKVSQRKHWCTIVQQLKEKKEIIIIMQACKEFIADLRKKY